MTHPTDDELDALVQELMNRPYRRGSESNDEAAMRRQGEREQAAAAITALRAQLADVQAERDVWEIDAKRNHQAAEIEFARADRAEAALAAQPHDPAKVQALVEQVKNTLSAYDQWANCASGTHEDTIAAAALFSRITRLRAAIAAWKEGK